MTEAEIVEKVDNAIREAVFTAFGTIHANGGNVLAEAALAAIRDTHAIVPREPTEPMWLAGNNAANPPIPNASHIYTAMIAAAEGEG